MRHEVERMRDVYADEIEKVRARGEEPAESLIERWRRYADAAESDDPGKVFLPER